MAIATALAVVPHRTAAIAVACVFGELVLIGFAALAFTYGTIRRARATAAVAALTSGACARAAFLASEPELGLLHLCSAVLSLLLAALVRRGA